MLLISYIVYIKPEKVCFNFCWIRLEPENCVRKVGTRFRKPNMAIIYYTPDNLKCVYFVGTLESWTRK